MNNRRKRGRLGAAATLTAVLVVAMASLFAAPAGAQSRVSVRSAFPAARASVDGSRIVGVTRVSERRFVLDVYSAAMGRVLGMQVIRPADTRTPAPTLYMLNGAEDGETPQGIRTWETQTDLVEFMADKHVNVVTMLDGAYTYFTDWRHDDPILGRNRWQTFLTEELPPVLNSAFTSTGRNGIVGLSMSATSVLGLAESSPGLYRSVGSFSGCSDLDNQVCATAVRGVVTLGHGNPDNMWGPVGGADWLAHNPGSSANLAKLRGTELYFASGSGAPGQYDNEADTGNDTTQLARQLFLGGGPEALVAQSTHRIQKRIDAIGVPATFRFTPSGTHSWLYWQNDLHAAWPDFAAALGISPTTSRDHVIPQASSNLRGTRAASPSR